MAAPTTLAPKIELDTTSYESFRLHHLVHSLTLRFGGVGPSVAQHLQPPRIPDLPTKRPHVTDNKINPATGKDAIPVATHTSRDPWKKKGRSKKESIETI